MKLPNFFENSDLNLLRYEMGAERHGEFSLSRPKGGLSLFELEQLSSGGIDVTGDAITVHTDGTLVYRGVRVLVYIRDVSTYHGRRDEESMPRFHFADCRTLDDMKTRNRFQRYVVATRNDGQFQVNEILPGGQRITATWALRACQNCLDALAFDGFSIKALGKRERRRRVDDFSLERFFAQYPLDVLGRRPIHTDETQPLNDYPDNWPQISQEVKGRAGYRCAECDLATDSRFLHVHHEDGQKFNCDFANLTCLCVGCHAEHHPHMKHLAIYAEFLARYQPRM